MRNQTLQQFSKSLRKGQTEAEYKLWYFLKGKTFGGLKFRRQYVIKPYIVDFCCLEKKLIIELDGGQHNEEKSQIYDEKRTEYLNKLGYKVLRFWDNDIFQNTDSVLEAISNSIGNPLPTLSLFKGEEK